MSDTHINAFFGDVDDKRQKLKEAEAELAAAEERLESKKQEVGYTEPEDTPKSKEETDKKGASGFGFGKRNKPNNTADENRL